MKPGILSSTFHSPEIMLNVITSSVSDPLAILRQAQDGVCPEYKVVTCRISQGEEGALAEGGRSGGEGVRTAPFLLILMLMGCIESHPPTTSVERASSDAVKTDLSSKLPEGFSVEATNDSTTWLYHYQDLLFVGRRPVHLRLVDPGRPKPTLVDTALHDTIYQDRQIVLLGRLEEMRGGVYKRYITKQLPEMYKVPQQYSGPLANPILGSDRNAQHFRTVIRDGCKTSGINFAGAYTIVEWGCGTACADMAMIDRRTGQIHLTGIPFDTLDGHFGLRYQKDSRLLIVNAYLLEPYDGYYELSWCAPAAYVWNEQRKQFELLERTKE